jgi:PTH1 family peptidyl-tRNA hydrolase
VLRPPRSEELTAIEAAIGKSLEAWSDIAKGDMERAMMKLHTKEKQ